MAASIVSTIPVSTTPATFTADKVLYQVHIDVREDYPLFANLDDAIAFAIKTGREDRAYTEIWKLVLGAACSTEGTMGELLMTDDDYADADDDEEEEPEQD